MEHDQTSWVARVGALFECGQIYCDSVAKAIWRRRYCYCAKASGVVIYGVAYFRHWPASLYAVPARKTGNRSCMLR